MVCVVPPASVDAGPIALRPVPAAPATRRGAWWVAPLVAVGIATVGVALGWRGVDLPAQLYRVALFHRNGLTLWDSQWYGGHWTLDYSVLFSPIAGTVGVGPTAVACAGLAAWAFDRLVNRHFGATARVGSLVFALGTGVQLAIGQLPFLMGEAFGLAACWAAVTRRWPMAIALGVATSLASPLAGAFLVLGALAWLVAAWHERRLGPALMMLAAAAPVGVCTVVFPGQGFFPYPVGDFMFELCACAVMWVLVPRRERALRVAVDLYIVATVVSFVLPSAVGGNVGRLGECVAVRLAACVLWPRRRWLLVALALPMALWQWAPAWASMTDQISRDPSTQQGYYAPLVSFLQRHGEPIGRVEVVPTRYHWEAVYVAPTVALARGWERQLDTADNPIFYDTEQLGPASYRAWLTANGVRYVALPDAPLDSAGLAESSLVSAGVPGLRQVWHDAHWRVYKVTGSPGIVSGPAHLVSLRGGNVTLEMTTAGTALVRVHYNTRWTVVSGAGCVHGTPEHWTAVDAASPGRLVLELRLVPSAASRC